jgi:hypothetical protein
VRRTLPLAGLLVVATAAAAAAGPLPDPAPWVLPVNAYAKAKPGDWTLLEGETVLGGKLVQQREVIRVGAVKGGVAEVQLFEGPADYERWFLSFPVDTRRGPDPNLLYVVPWIATGMTRAKATCTLGAGKPFPCTKVSFATPSSTVTVLMAPRVRGSGIVSYEVVRDGKPVWTMKAIGYGTAKKVEWGAGPSKAPLDVLRDTSNVMIGMREGSAHAVEDVYEGGPAAEGVPAQVELDTVAVTGDMDRAIVTRYLKRKVPAMTSCWEKLVASKPGLTREQVIAGFTIDERGLLVALITTGTPALKWCVTENLDGLQFPQSDGGGRNLVEATFTFDPGVPRPKKPVKRRLISKGHPMRGGPDLRGVTITVNP